LRKEKIDNEDNIVKSFVLKGDKTIGYIFLPAFYTEWENETGSSCANDVAKEIIKLKRDNIDGLILDVRYNGGGSIEEAIQLTGIFIDEGPLAAEKITGNKVTTMRDPNRGTIFDGPMVLLVNGQSASASEMLAASLQDYNRALIAGSNTYGKATMQGLFALDTINTKPARQDNENDLAKITIGKLFRVNGHTAQLTGVIPDILFPDAFDGLPIGERFEDFPLTADTVKRNNYYKPLSGLPVAALAAKSAARLTANPDFALIRKIVDEQKKLTQAGKMTIPLQIEQFEKWSRQQELNNVTLKGAVATKASFSAENHTQDKQRLTGDAYDKEINDAWLESLAADIYIQETAAVLADLINLQKTNVKN